MEADATVRPELAPWHHRLGRRSGANCEVCDRDESLESFPGGFLIICAFQENTSGDEADSVFASRTQRGAMHTIERSEWIAQGEAAPIGGQGAWWSEVWTLAHLGHLRGGRTALTSQHAAAANSSIDRGKMAWCDQCLVRMVHVASGCACLHAVVLHSRHFCTGGPGGLETPSSELVGPDGVVVWWLKVQSVTALAIPVMSSLLAYMRLQYHWQAMCVQYLASAFQTVWFMLGSALSFGSGAWAVPQGCRDGQWGDNTASTTVFGICAAWLVCVSCIAIVSCIVGCAQVGRIRRMSQWAKYSKNSNIDRNSYVPAVDRAESLRATGSGWSGRARGGAEAGDEDEAADEACDPLLASAPPRARAD